MNRGTYYFPRNRTYQEPTATNEVPTTGPTCLPVYNGIDITGADYTMPGEGIYFISNNDHTHAVILPNAVTNDGHTVILIPGSSTDLDVTGDIISFPGGTTISYGRMYSYVAISGSWAGEIFRP